MLTIYNTLTRKKEEFKPITQGKINMYVCGPTVYDLPHIGHARSAYIFDVIRRFLEYSGYKVNFIRNVTDVDDKIINKAIKELEAIGEKVSQNRLKERTSEVAVRYLDVYHHQMDVLGIRPPTEEPKATENIDEMLKFIGVLIDKGIAYEAGGNVYFSVDKFDGYGKLSKQDIDEMLEGARVDPDKNKRYPLDFALWKKSKPQEPFWESPWGDGRPGWHIECSVMSTKILGEQFDIHGGGLDLIFPHHENEIAQAEACTGKNFANYWIHNGLLTVDSEKMAKSLGNFITIEEFLKEYNDADLLKIAFLTSHYRSPMDYTKEKIEESKRSKERILIFFDKVERVKKSLQEKNVQINNADEIEKAQKIINIFQEKFDEKMNDDFNTPQAFSIIFEAVKKGNDILSCEAISQEEKACKTEAIKNFIIRFCGILGLSLKTVKLDDAFESKINNLVEKRQLARKNKDYAASDKIRDELTHLGVTVEDTPEGPVWRKN